MAFAELHSHLYGCLTLDDLRYLKSRNGMRETFFADSYRRAYGRDPDLTGLFDSDRSLSSLYHFRGPPDFPKFQASFDLIISLSSTEPEELREVVLRVAQREPAQAAEYRQLFSPFIEISLFQEKVAALCEAIAEANRAHPGKKFRLAMSVPRSPEAGPRFLDAVYRVADSEAGQVITGIDFCAEEEGFPPESAREMLSLIQSRPVRGRPLDILYHVGESFRDKSVESAVRWVLEAARMGAARLGHAAALGLDPREFLGQTRMEIAGERKNQIRFELLHAESLRDAGISVHEDSLKHELASLRGTADEQTIPAHYSEERARRLGQFQDWAMQQIRATSAVIECCPSSNLAIVGMRFSHPVKRFIRAGLPVVIGADDPGIFDTDLNREFELLRRWEVSENDIRQMQDRSVQIAERL